MTARAAREIAGDGEPSASSCRAAALGSTRAPTIALLIVAIAYLLLQHFLIPNDLYLEYDEAVYLAEVNPQVSSYGFDAHRSRGITLIAAPIAWFDPSIGVVRLYMAIVSAVFLVGAYHPWISLVGWSAPIGAAALGSTWLAILYGSHVSPNLFVTFCAIAAIGYIVRSLRKPSTRDWLAAALAFALLAQIRPADAAWVAAALLVPIVLRRCNRSAALPILAGLALGLLPWIVEAIVRFGGVIERLERASNIVNANLGIRIWEHLSLADGPLIGPDPRGPSIFSLAWWAIWMLFAALGIRRGSELYCPTWVIPILTALAALTFPYWFVTGALAPRFLLPTYGLSSLILAVGVVALWKAHGPVGIAAFAGLAALVVGHLVVAQAIGRDQLQARLVASELAAVVEQVADGHPCYLASEYGSPQIAYGSGCPGIRLILDSSTMPTPMARAQARGELVFALTLHDPPTTSFLADWHANPVEVGRECWTLWTPTGINH